MSRQSGQWLTLSEAARRLGLSPRTVRRWIHDGKLRAELRPGPYGQQYLVPIDAMDAAQVVRDVERIEREAERERIPAIVEEYLARRETPLLVALEDIREQLRRLEEGQSALRDEIAQLRDEPSAGDE